MSGGGVTRAVRAALAEAGIGPEDVDHVNAHGLGTRESDIGEANGLHAVFGDKVSGFGLQELHGEPPAPAAAVTELAACILAAPAERRQYRPR